MTLITKAVVAGIFRDPEAPTAVYIQQRPQGKEFAGKWELPGGKVEQGETLEEALVRELLEELRGSFRVMGFVAAAVKQTDAGVPYVLHFFNVQLTHGSFLPTHNAWRLVTRDWLAHPNVREQLLHEDLEMLLQIL